MPVIVYSPEADGRRHGNFIRASYAKMLKRPEWARRLTKIHAGARRSLPKADRKWCELDSCTSSDALSYQLMRNVLAAYASESSFCVIADERRLDLIEACTLLCAASARQNSEPAARY